MPSTILISKSALLGPNGWFTASAAGSVRLLGVDRHGQISTGEAKLEFTGAQTRGVFLAAGAAFGHFASQGSVLDSEGRRHVIGDIAEKGTIADLRFETYAQIGARSADTRSFSDIWTVLLNGGAISFKSGTIIRCRIPAPDVASAFQATKAPFARVVESGSRAYCVINERLLGESFVTDWQKTILILGGLCFGAPESIYRVEKQQTLIGLWLLSALKKSGDGFSLKYDGIQYTVCVHLVASDAAPRSLERGMCACLEPDTSRECKLIWSDRSWSPIANGYLLSSG